MFEFAFMQRAFAGGIAIAAMAGLLGVFVVQRGLAFLGDGLAHASFGGIALGALVAYGVGTFGILDEPLVVALPFTLVVSLGIAAVRDRTDLSSDTAIGVFFALSVALGVMFLSLIPPDRNVVDVWHLLFGSILAVGPRDLWIILGVAAVTLTVLTALWGRLGYATFDPELAQTDGVAVRRLEYALFALAAVVVVVSAQVVGVVLMASYLVIPAAAARLLARSLGRMTVLSLAFGILSTVAGLMISYGLDVPSGSTIVLVQSALFGAAFTGSAVVRARG
jgi:zinc transport system permease protein